jgi:hypothetical protein
VAEVLTQNKPNTSASQKDTLKNIWDKSTEELFNDVDSYYKTLIEIDKQNLKNEKSQNQIIRDLSLSLEELWKRQELPYNQNDICNKIMERLAVNNTSKSLRITVARQLDARFKRKYTKPITNDTYDSNVAAATFPDSSNEHAQSDTIFENAKSNLASLKSLDLDHLTPSHVQDLEELASNINNKVSKYCRENNIQTVEIDSTESELDRLRKQAKGKPIPCPTPEGVDQKNITTEEKNDNEILKSLRTQGAKELYLYGKTWMQIAINYDNYPATMEGDDEKIAQTFKTHREFLECYNDIKCKRDLIQWSDIIEIYHKVSKHNAASSDLLKVFGVSCSNCGSRMHPIEKMRDEHRYHWRCPNYYKTESKYIGCKKDEPLSRDISKERITEFEKFVKDWAKRKFETLDVYKAFIFMFRNYKQPYHTEHTKLLEPKFERRGV